MVYRSDMSGAERYGVVSLIASATEILCALGLRERLVGVSHECDFPEDVRGLPVLSEPKVDPRAPSGAIDKAVREIVRDGLSVYRVRVEELERLRPDLVVTQDQCEVCAVSLKDVEEALRSLTLKRTRVCSLRPRNLQDIGADFVRVGEAAGVSRAARRLLESFQQRLDSVKQKAHRAARRPTVICLEWLDPVMAAGGWIPELVEMAGGTPLLVDSTRSFATVTWHDIGSADPDIIVLMPCGFTLRRTQKELQNELLAAPLRELRATRAGRCFVADGNAYFNRPGPRIADSAEILASLVHPDLWPHHTGAARWSR